MRKKEEYDKLHKKYIKLKEGLVNFRYYDGGTGSGAFIEYMSACEELQKDVSELEQKLNSFK